MKCPDAQLLSVLRCPSSGEPVLVADGKLANRSGTRTYEITESGIPLFAARQISPEGRIQQEHYDRVAASYIDNLGYPHTQEYMRYLDEVLVRELRDTPLGLFAELCCGRGEAFRLIEANAGRGIGVDVSLAMLEIASADFRGTPHRFVQGDVTALPLADDAFDNVFMLGGIHHVSARERLFAEIHRILKPGGRFYWREPVSDFWLWRWIRAVVYRLSPHLDANTERPLLYAETVPVLERVGLRLRSWRTYGFFGFCIFMNSDVLVFNRLFRFIPGIRTITRWAARLDDLTVRLPGLGRYGLQVVGVAEKPAQ